MKDQKGDTRYLPLSYHQLDSEKENCHSSLSASSLGSAGCPLLASMPVGKEMSLLFIDAQLYTRQRLALGGLGLSSPPYVGSSSVQGLSLEREGQSSL